MYNCNEGDLMKFLKSLLKDLMLITGNEGGYAWAIPAAMATMGYLQGEEQKAQNKHQNKVAATQTQFSPWTGMGKGQTVREGSGGFGGAVQGGLTGASMAQNYGQAQQATKMNDLKMQQMQMQNPASPAYFDNQMVNQQRDANQLYSGSRQPSQNTWSSMYS